jgi:hypothetical protein
LSDGTPVHLSALNLESNAWPAGETEDGTMTKNLVILASAIVLLNSAAFAQQQYDSLGSPTPAPNQSASPTATNPNGPIPGDKSGTKPATTGKAATDGSGSSMGSAKGTKSPSNDGVNAPMNSGMPADNGATPNGLTPD